MTRKDFELIAQSIRNASVDPLSRREVAYSFAIALEWNNARFDRKKFLTEALGTKDV